jgi:mediator of RNA polymerase II transcription subunit 8, fungi type
MEPQVETWVAEGRAIGDNAASTTSHDEELWTWATGWIGDRVAKYALEEAGDNYTVEEREGGIENVNTGLRRKLEEDESSDDEDEDEEMEDVGVNVTSARRTSSGQLELGMGEVRKDPDGKTRSVEDILRLATRGTVIEHSVGGLR